MKITLRVFENSNELQSKSFGEGVFRIGRSEFSDLVLPNEKVSRSHVELRINEIAIYFTNMSHPGQVKLNGKPKETGEISDGDELTIGPYSVLVVYGEVAAVSPAEEMAAPSDAPEGVGVVSEEEAREPFAVFADGVNASEGSAVRDIFASVSPQKDASQMSGSLALADTDVENKAVVAKLMFVEGPKKGEELSLEAYEITFGRSKKADIYLDDERLSRVHCKIARVGMGYRLVDLDSRNGTFVNGVRVLEHPLSSFDEIQIGDTKIKFLVHDVLIPGMQSQQPTNVVGIDIARADQTESVAMAALDPKELQALRGGGAADRLQGMSKRGMERFKKLTEDPGRRRQLLIGLVVGLLLVYLILPGGESSKEIAKPVSDAAALSDSKVPPMMPKEFSELSADDQRAIEGHYNAALKAADSSDFDSAVSHMKSIHDTLPFYKKSRELFDRYAKKLKEKQMVEAAEKAKNDEKQDLAMYLQDGIEYLKEGDFEKAGEAFNSAVVIDPTNPIAAKGLRAADAKVRNMDDLPPEVDPETEKKKVVVELFQKAIAALQQKQYQEAINGAEQARLIEIKGDTQYLSQAKQIIDQAKILQKEEFEPFLISAKEKFAEGDYNESRNLCEEMLKKDSSYEEAKECVLKAKKNLNRLAKEAYTHGYVLESMNRIEEAKQYWNRAKNYVRPGDEYYDKVMHKLDYYQ